MVYFECRFFSSGKTKACQLNDMNDSMNDLILISSPPPLTPSRMHTYSAFASYLNTFTEPKKRVGRILFFFIIYYLSVCIGFILLHTVFATY